LDDLEKSQEEHQSTMKLWEKKHQVAEVAAVYHRIDTGFWQRGCMYAVPADDGLRRKILKWLHDAPTAGHPGRDETTRAVASIFWWPGMRSWIEDYVKGCAQCQQNKNLTH
jgi:hypothetical protein